MDLRITFQEAVGGCEKDVRISPKVLCNNCDGTGAAPGTKRIKCTTCNGTGEQRIVQGFFQFAGTCTSCNGQGTLIQTPCSVCKGSGTKSETKTIRVKVPPGVDNGTNIRLQGQGGVHGKGAKPGNLFIRIFVEDDPVFKRDGYDVHVEVPISLSTAILGGTALIPTLTGEVEIRVSPGIQPFEKRVLRNKGIKKLNSTQYGNQYIHFSVTIPKNITEQQRKLLEEFAKEEKPPEPTKGFFSKFKNFLK